jgi:DNA-binding transcriptional ArsR family regulator
MAMGDLRGLLKALEDGITALLGLTRGGEDAAPIEAHDLSVVLKHRYQLELRERTGDTHWPRLQAWAALDPATVQVQAELKELWGLSQPSVSQALRQLIEAGAVEALPRQGGDPIQYALSGSTRLALASG